MSRTPPLDKYDPLSIWGAFLDPAGIPDLFIAYSFDIGDIRDEYFAHPLFWSKDVPPNYPGDSFFGV